LSQTNITTNLTIDEPGGSTLQDSNFSALHSLLCLPLKREAAGDRWKDEAVHQHSSNHNKGTRVRAILMRLQKRIGGMNIPAPFNPALGKLVLPDENDIVRAVQGII
jgi:hypothetical protein